MYLQKYRSVEKSIISDYSLYVLVLVCSMWARLFDILQFVVWRQNRLLPVQMTQADKIRWQSLTHYRPCRLVDPTDVMVRLLVLGDSQGFTTGCGRFMFFQSLTWGISWESTRILDEDREYPMRHALPWSTQNYILKVLPNPSCGNMFNLHKIKMAASIGGQITKLLVPG